MGSSGLNDSFTRMCEGNNSSGGVNGSNISDCIQLHDNTTLEMGPPLYMYAYVTLVNVVVFLVGIVGNVLVIQVVLGTKSMRRRMNYFLMSLSVADLLVLVVCQPIALMEFYGKEKWYFGNAMCKIVPLLENASHHCSVFTLLAIGFERYYAICHPLKETVGGRMSSTWVLIPTVWIVSFVVTLPFAIISQVEVIPYYDGSHVDICVTDMDSHLSRIYIVFIFVVFLCWPLILLTAMYTAIIRTLSVSITNSSGLHSSTRSLSICSRQGHRDSNVQLQQQQHLVFSSQHQQQQQQFNKRHSTDINSRAVASRRQVVRMMVAVMALYFICLVPLRCVQLWAVFVSASDKEALGFEGYLNLINLVRLLISINSAGNPIIYSLLSTNFRAAFRHSFFGCRKKPQGDGWRYNTAYYSNNASVVTNHMNMTRMTSMSSASDSPKQRVRSTSLLTDRDGLLLEKYAVKARNSAGSMDSYRAPRSLEGLNTETKTLLAGKETAHPFSCGDVEIVTPEGTYHSNGKMPAYV